MIGPDSETSIARRIALGTRTITLGGGERSSTHQVGFLSSARCAAVLK